MSVAIPRVHDGMLDWWLRARRPLVRRIKRGFDSFVIAVAWSLWKQRNARVFNQREQEKNVDELHLHILNELKEWKDAGLGVGSLHHFMREEL